MKLLSILLRTMDLVVAVPPEPEAASTAVGSRTRIPSAFDTGSKLRYAMTAYIEIA